MSAYKTNIVERKYSRDFLLHFKQFFTDPPEGLPDVAIVRTSTHCRSLTHTLRADEEWQRLGPRMFSMVASQRAPPKPRTPKTPQMSPPPLTDVTPLQVSDNRWQPSAHQRLDDTEVILRKVKGVLNKLTMEKFDRLVGQILAMNISRPDVLEGLIRAIFEKAIAEPSFSVLYASCCDALANAPGMPTVTDEKGVERSLFRILLVQCCQAEFNKQLKDDSTDGAGVDEEDEKEKEKDVKESNSGPTTPPKGTSDKEEELSVAGRTQTEETEWRRTLGNIRFIGELFIRGLININPITRCMNRLSQQGSSGSEAALEELCKLITTIGKQMDAVDVMARYLNKRMEHLDQICNDSALKLSSRIRFMIKDVIELRENHWVPRAVLQPESTPEMTPEEVRQQALNEERQKKLTHPSSPWKGSGRGQAPSWGRRTVSESSIGAHFGFSEDVNSGPRRAIASPPSRRTQRISSPSQSPRSAWGSSAENSPASAGLHDPSRPSSATPKSTPPGSSPQFLSPTSPQPLTLSSPSATITSASASASAEVEAKLLKQARLLVEEYMQVGDLAEAAECVKDLGDPTFHPQAVNVAIAFAVEENFSPAKCRTVAEMLLHTHNEGILSTGDFCAGLELVARNYEEMLMDTPRAADILVPTLLCLASPEKGEGVFSVSDILAAFERARDPTKLDDFDVPANPKTVMKLVVLLLQHSQGQVPPLEEIVAATGETKDGVSKALQDAGLIS